MKCIICETEINDGQIICEECKEMLVYFKEQYIQTKKLLETTELDDQVFDMIYRAAEIDNLVEDIGLFDDTDIDELLDEIIRIADQNPAFEWMRQQPGRLDSFTQYTRNRMKQHLEECEASS